MSKIEFWRETPFICHFVSLQAVENKTNMPFTIGGATQQGPYHALDNLNNQDAAGIFVDENCIVGIVCDGCSGTHPEVKNGFSNNEIAAKLTVHIFIKLIREYIVDKEDISDKEFINDISFEAINIMSSFKHLFSYKEKEFLFIADFLMSTVIGFVIHKDRYIIFNVGDGVIGINGQIKLLHDEEGNYFCDKLHRKENDNGLKVFSTGSADDLKSIFIASDGFYEIVDKHESMFKQFINPSTLAKKRGIDHYILPEFRKKTIWNKVIRETTDNTGWFKDDATFVLLRRVE